MIVLLDALDAYERWVSDPDHEWRGLAVLLACALIVMTADGWW